MYQDLNNKKKYIRLLGNLHETEQKHKKINIKYQKVSDF